MNSSLEAHPITDDTKKRKAFVPIENNPDVLSALIHRLGLSSELSFYDVFSIDDADLLSFIPRPAIALLLVFPVSKAYEEFRSNEDQNNPDYDIKGTQDVIWYKQTIRNACGIMAILHAASNGESRKFIKSDSDLDKLIKQAIPLGPIERADLIYNFEALETAHQDAAYQGQSCAPRAEEDIDLHYVCFTKGEDNVLWELDGRRKGPLNRGKLGVEDDLLSEKSLELSVRSFLKREEAAGNSEIRFSLMALAPSSNNVEGTK
ncbi:Ubiquitin carboxyl-terminal hydrolase isozyme L3 [Erysiphe neolycopersici]|uniref:Ubiquitin carboxyl-terminal hydrolase n=1 Tax=Erysiphe neolycopersici TaxID=212602 RepID=A0A420I1F4_9PEZI|nr:Ubiquitin carboxyl-terminal hydrolase isozyme L3 [Erysiphe neolycopersici]